MLNNVELTLVFQSCACTNLRLRASRSAPALCWTFIVEFVCYCVAPWSSKPYAWRLSLSATVILLYFGPANLVCTNLRLRASRSASTLGWTVIVCFICNFTVLWSVGTNYKEEGVEDTQT